MEKQQFTDILSAARDGYPDQVAWRRHLHRHPEIAFEEHDTTRFLRDTCRTLGLAERKLTMKTGLLAEVRGIRKTPIVAIRTDIDALPVTEQTGLEFASCRPGFMHACGHDMHMATVLGAARILARMANRLPGTIRFLFQPAEEHPPGGARPMIAEGAIDSVTAILGLHVDPHVPTGKIGLRDGVTMASVTDFDLVIHGTGGHAARPQDAVDAIVVASELIAALQTVVSRHTDPISSVAVTFGRIEGGTARNVIADEVRLTGTARSLSAADARRLPKLIKRTADGICRAHGAKATMNLIADYPEIKELDVNPLLVTPEDVIALDARVVVDREMMVHSVRPYAHLAIRPYPDEFVAERRLKDGTPVVLRPIKPEDEPMWHELLAGCSTQSLWFRFSYLFKQTTHEMATRYCFIDYDREIGIVAEVEEEGDRKLIAVGRLVADMNHDAAEYA